MRLPRRRSNVTSAPLIGVDTNVLLRLLVTDDADQHRLSTAFFEARTADRPAFVNNVVLVEFSWVLRRRYGYSKSQVLHAVRYLAATTDIRLENDRATVAAVDTCQSSGEEFGDVFIAAINAHHGVQKTMTFDKAASRRLPGMELLQ